MRRMYSEKQIKRMVAESSDEVVEAIQGQDITPKDVNASGNITGKSIIENMSGYAFTKLNNDMAWNAVYAGIVKNGNKLTIVIFGSYSRTSAQTISACDICSINMPSEVMNKLYPYTIAGEDRVLTSQTIIFQDVANVNTQKSIQAQVLKTATPRVQVRLFNIINGLTEGHDYVFRIELTFLLSDSLAE